MATIRETIELVDQFSPVIKNIVGTVNYAITAMEQMADAMNFQVDGSALESARAQLDRTNDEMRRLSGAANEAEAGINKLDNIMKKAAGSTSEAAKELKKTDSAAKEIVESMKGAEKATENFSYQLAKVGQTNLSVGQINLSGVIDNLLKEYDRKIGEKQKSYENLGNAANDLNNLYMALGGYKILGFVESAFTSTTSAAMEFESAVTGIYKTVDGSAEQLAGLSDAVKQMALEVPSSATEIAGVMESAGQLGIDTDNIENFSRTMIDLANSTNMTSEVAASSLAKFANITNMDASQYQNLGSAIVDLGNNFATTESDIVDMSSYLASAASLAGFAESDILALATAMSSVGISAEAGGSSMSTLITQMQLAVETGDGLEDFAEVADMSMQQFSDTFQNDAVGALQAFIGGLDDVEKNGASASSILQQMNLDDIRLSNTVRSLAGNETLLSSAVSTASQAWNENTALTNEAGKRYDTLESKLKTTKNAADNFKTAVGSSLAPAIDGLSGAAKGLLGGLGDIVDKFPALTAGLAGTVGTAVAVAAGFATIVPAINVVKTSWAALNKTIALSKIGIAIGVLSAVVGIGTAVYTSFKKAEDSVADYNGTLEQCRNEIELTQDEYIAVCQRYGETSIAAQKLAGDIDVLNSQYQKGGGVVSDYAQRLVENQEKLNSFVTEYDDKIKSIDDSWQNGFVAVAQLEKLSSKAHVTNSDLDLMSRYADYLNNTFNCNIEVNYNTKKLTGFKPENVESQMEKIALDNKKQAAFDSVSNVDFTKGYEKAYKDLESAKSKYEAAKIDFDHWNGNSLYKGFGSQSVIAGKAKKALELEQEVHAMEEVLSGYQNQINEAYTDMGVPEQAVGYIKILDDIAAGYKNVSESAGNSSQAVEDSSQASTQALDNQQKKVQEIQDAYEQSFNSIRSNLDGMFGLFDKANELKFNPDFSTDNLMASLESQLKYFEQYEQSVNKLKELNLSDAIISQLNPEQAYSLVEQFNQLGKQSGESAVTGMIEEINSKFGELSIKKDSLTGSLAESDVATQFGDLSAAKSDMEAIKDLAGQIDFSKPAEEAKTLVKSFDEFSDTKDELISAMGEIKTSISSELDQIKQNVTDRVNQIVNALDFSSEAAQKANSSMASYARAISRVGAVAVRNAKHIASQVSAALSSVDTSINFDVSASAIGHARGTTNAEDIFIAGEEGPELIVGKQGSTVFPTSETNRILSAISGFNSPNKYSIADNRLEGQIINNYNTVQNSFDDSNIIKVLDDINHEISNFNPLFPTSNVVVDLSFLDNIVSNFKTGNNINNFNNNYNKNYNENFTTVSQTAESVGQPYDFIYPANNNQYSETVSRKEFTIKFEGGEEIKIPANNSVNKNDIIELLLKYTKPVLANILSGEILEEGENSYDY